MVEETARHAGHLDVMRAARWAEGLLLIAPRAAATIWRMASPETGLPRNIGAPATGASLNVAVAGSLVLYRLAGFL